MYEWVRDVLRRLGQLPRSNACCSFCGVSYATGGPLIEGPHEVFICPACVEIATERSADQPVTVDDSPANDLNPYAPPKTRSCSYCRTPPKIGIVLTSPDGGKTICTECAKICVDVLKQHRERIK